MMLAPDLAIGVLEGPPAFVFGRISGIDVDAQGRLYVVDAQAREVRVFSADGEHVLTLAAGHAHPVTATTRRSSSMRTSA